MPRDITGVLFARSHRSIAAAGREARELDFDLGANFGIRVLAVRGTLLQTSTATTSLIAHDMHQQLTLDPDAGEDLARTGDAEDLDTSIIWDQWSTEFMISVATSAGHNSVTPMYTGWEFFPREWNLFTARNLAHVVESEDTTAVAEGIIMLAYNYVQFGADELGILLARRGR